MYADLYLKKNEERRLRAGHLWIYSNEIDVQKTSLKNFQSGELVKVLSSNGKSLGLAYINPHSLLSARLLTKNEHETINVDFFRVRIRAALNRRTIFFAEPYYRLIYGESDLLPGVVIDRFADTYVIQITTAGMEQLKELLLAAADEKEEIPARRDDCCLIQ